MTGEYTSCVTFRMGDELYAVAVAQVREVIDVTRITPVPTAPAYLCGLVNVRGQVVPVVDLRLRIGLPEAGISANTRIVVMELQLEGEAAVLGVIADSVHDVVELETLSIGPAPRMAARWRSEFIRGIARWGDDFVIVLDVSAIFSSEEIVMAAPPPGGGGDTDSCDACW